MMSDGGGWGVGLAPVWLKRATATAACVATAARVASATAACRVNASAVVATAAAGHRGATLPTRPSCATAGFSPLPSRATYMPSLTPCPCPACPPWTSPWHPSAATGGPARPRPCALACHPSGPTEPWPGAGPAPATVPPVASGPAATAKLNAVPPRPPASIYPAIGAPIPPPSPFRGSAFQPFSKSSNSLIVE